MDATPRNSARFCDACGSAIVVPAVLPDPSPPLPPIPDSARKAKTLSERFVLIGTLAGRTRAEVEGVVGPPNFISAMASAMAHGLLLEWMETRLDILGASSYHIALTFDADICTGVARVRELMAAAYE